MADLKISALPASTTPLAGTEVLPIVQSGVTRQVSVANLTAGRAISATAVTASTGNFIVGTSGQGVDFSATPGTGTSELFSDYEEGTFTPTISGSSSAGTGTYSTQLGYYTKIGNLVYVTATIVWSAHTGTGNMRLSGLPFTVLNVTSLEPPLSLQVSDVTLTALNVAQATFRRNATYAEVLQYPVGGGAVTDVPIDTAATIRYAGSF
jgi:hypothetical protein